MTTLQTVFAKAKADDRAALIGYLPAGFPSKDGAIAVATAMVEAGCDVIEIGLPYSDPLMDGPTIQDAVHRSLVNGTRIADVLRTVEGVAKTGAATLVMTYWNPIDRYGVDRFARDLAAAGGVGTITPDLTPEEAGPWRAASADAGIDTVFLVAPSSTEARIKAVADSCTGFVYAASLMGVTGARDQVGTAAQGLVERTRPHTSLPVCVGLGVGTGRQAAEVAGYADGVIVGSAFIRRVLDAPDEASALASVRELGAELAAGVRA
ncbi:tryptophan synthase alpha chain [Streptosporangium becharense]|uniref:Tryptophan synthase alpha chain n=1 Tax=Streptosporangium becharense TaxID=1816182 RepID=A0A7W9MEY2_9ACTN|nr:tryptophan synthase subunit alpha [Streptosporangium becharense]MBB2912915.1 tryptophan synthase alpha chain [Streptosporangium becharense]MBB5818260.1 tryptophan synthase alpha chain [Streptosporangium becharense]